MENPNQDQNKEQKLNENTSQSVNEVESLNDNEELALENLEEIAGGCGTKIGSCPELKCVNNGEKLL